MIVKNSRAQRRHDRARLKKKRHTHWGYGKQGWRSYCGTERDSQYEMSPTTLGMVVNTPTPCSCYMCGNPRRAPWADDPLTMQERKAEASYFAGLDEVLDADTYRWEKYDAYYDNWYGADPADDKYLRWMYIKGSPMVACECCGKQGAEYKQFWSMYNYHGINGWICVKCYNKVEHDKDGNPKNPTEYLMILLKQENGDGKET